MTDTARQPNLSELFALYANRTFLRLPGGEDITYAAFWERAERQARRLMDLGVAAGDRVVVRLENSEHLLGLYLACALAGVAVCPVDPALPAARISGVERHIKPRLTIDAAVLDQLLEKPSGKASLPAFDDARDFVIIYSSGTTGEPKGIVHTLGALVRSAQSFAALSDLHDGSVVYHHFPMFYMAGIFNMFLCPAVAGATIVVGPRFSNLEMMRFWTLPRQFGVNHLTLTPTMAQSLIKLYRATDDLPDHLARYQAIISTGSTLYDSVAERFHSTFGVPLRSCYGVTEVGGSITLQSWAEALARESVGAFQRDTVIRAGTPDAPAEISVRTPFMMRGYLTADGVATPFDSEGFFKTGDLGYVRDGSLYVTGREADLIKKGGEFVSLPLVENLALGCSDVVEAAAVAVPDEYWGSRIVLFYMPAANGDCRAIEGKLQEVFDGGLRKVERPDKLIAVPWMPKTSIGKIVKRDLVDRYTL